MYYLILNSNIPTIKNANDVNVLPNKNKIVESMFCGTKNPMTPVANHTFAKSMKYPDNFSICLLFNSNSDMFTHFL